MCDTYIALKNATKDESVIFGKNSDRLGDEAQLITYAPRIKHLKGELLKCTHISIPQVSETYSIILSQPWWMWGAEMGANENSVVIGNEAVATKEPLKEKGLLGMDLLRLGLERGKSAKNALDIIINLLETYGQGGFHNKKGLNYHNSMIIADSKEAFVLEIAGEWWIVEFVKDYRSISNNISIRGKGDMRRKGIIEYAVKKGYCKDDNDFDFKMAFSSSPLPGTFPLDSRDGCSLNQLSINKRQITVPMMMAFLREHDVGICMHARNNQSVGSQVSHLRDDKTAIHWFTGSTVPCLSVFKPYTFPIEGQKHLEAKAYNEINPEWFWSNHSEFIQKFIKNPKKDNPERNAYYKKLRNIENSFLENVNDVINNDSISKAKFVEKIKEINNSAWQNSEEMIK